MCKFNPAISKKERKVDLTSEYQSKHKGEKYMVISVDAEKTVDNI